jgi:ABC-type transport system involved in cytochrome c biogenesis ATPase subunit
VLRSIEILALRAIRYARLDLNGFQVLVGPNASGKSTLLDALTLIRDVLTVGIDRALRGDARFDVAQRVADPRDLTWMRSGDPVEIVMTFDLPDDIRSQLQEPFVRARYECGLDVSGELRFYAETLFICKADKAPAATSNPQAVLFPGTAEPPPHIVKLPNKQVPAGWKKIVFKDPDSGNDTFSSETGTWNNPFRLGPERSALANLPADEAHFPAALWVRRLVMEGVHRIQLNAEKMRMPSPAGSPTIFLPDGSNLPWVVHELETRDPAGLRRWIEHVRTALPDIEQIGTHDREEDRARYLQVTYTTGLTAPSWVLSDGTLRMLALTLLAYTPRAARILLIEEPENGIHPRAVEAVVQSLQSVYDGQVFVATHSPLVLSQVQDKDLLCFAKDHDGAVAIVRGDEHPRLAHWRSGLNLGDLFAKGILG